MNLKRLGRLCAGLLAAVLVFADLAPAYAANNTVEASTETVKSIKRTGSDAITFTYGSWGYTVGTTVSKNESGNTVIKGGSEITRKYLSGMILNKIERTYSVSGNISGNSKKKAYSFTESSATKGYVNAGTLKKPVSTGYTFWFNETFNIKTNKKTYKDVPFDSANWRKFLITQQIFEADGKTPAVIDENGYVAIGDYIAVIAAKNGKGASLKVPFSVTESATVKDMRKAKVTICDVEYTGKKQTPAAVVTYKGKKLTQGKDYTIEYTNNEAVGMASAVLKGKGSYSGKITADFEIFAENDAEYEVAFDGNGATEGGLNKLTGRTRGKNYTLPESNFKRAGYVFAGWNTSADGTGKYFGNKAKVSNISGSKDSVTLYAQWEAVVYNVKFNANGGKGTMKAIKDVQYDSAVKLGANKFTKSGYKFAGWATKKNSKKVVYKNKAEISNLTTKNGKTVTLYAVWKKK